MRLKELRPYLKGNKLVKHLTPNPRIDTRYFTHLAYDREHNCLAFVMMDEWEPLTTDKVLEFLDNLDILGGVPDDALITVDAPWLTENNNNLVRWICEDDTAIAINEKASENIAEELNARFKDYLERKTSDGDNEDFIQSCLDDGFTLEDLKLIDNFEEFYSSFEKSEMRS